MAFRLQPFKKLLPEIQSSLKAFQNSDSKFKLLKTVSTNSSLPENPKTPVQPSPKTLFILDSSFNPPSTAHRNIATSVLQNSKFTGPHRLLLLFAIMNADKAPSPAAFEQRILMMTIFARDLLSSLPPDHSPVSVDIGVTKAPYYTDKSVAISSGGSEWYPDQPKHIHLVGFDTLTRFFGAKYYSSFSPPFSALEPYFSSGHRLRVTLRPDNDYGSIDEQKAFLQKLRDGEMESDGAKREWAEQIELVEPNKEEGVSSTKIRKAAKDGKWDVVEGLCTEGVAAWVEEERLYKIDAEGAKMA